MGGGREKEAKTNGGTDRKSTKHDEKSEKSPEKEVEVAVAPDGGWGWMVVLASFAIHVIADGIVYSFGIFYVEFLDYYKGGKGETAWVGSLVPGVTLTVGPLASILTNKYGCRATTIAGSIIASAGFILSLFAPNLYFLYFSFGIMAGLGFGLIYLPAIVSVAEYFDERRAFATGLAVCGSGLGAFIFNPLSKFLIDEFGWRGAILIEAGIILNCVLCGALFRPLVPQKVKPDTDIEHDKHKEHVLDSQEMELFIRSSIDIENEKPKELKHITDVLEMELVISHNFSNGLPEDNAHGDGQSNQIVTTSPSNSTLGKGAWLQPAGDTAMFRSDGALNISNIRRQTRTRDPSPLALDQSNKPPQLRRLLSHQDRPRPPVYHHVTPGGIYQSGSLMNIAMLRSSPSLYITSLRSLHAHDLDEEKKLCCFTVKPEIYYSLKQMCDFSLLKDTIFLMFVISNFFTSIGFNMPFIFLTDRAVDEGIDERDAAWLVSVIGISNTFGRVIFGFLADKRGVNRLMLYSIALTICGIATALAPLCSNYPLLVVYACVFGLFIGVYVSLTSVVLVDLLGIEMLTHSFGLLLMFQGIATLVGPPIAGWLYDGTGSYDVSFIVAGVVVAISGIMLFFIPLVRKCCPKKDENVA